MKRFQTEHFMFVSKRDPSLFGAPDSSSYENLPEDVADDGISLDEDDGTVEFVRITKDGYEYVAKFGASELARGRSTEPSSKEGENLRRSLVVLGDDTRSKVASTLSFPFSAIAEIDYGSSGEGGCSSTLISRNAALTAGHCVYNEDKKEWYALNQIAPGRYRSDSRSSIEPYGAFEVEYSTTFSEWKSKGSSKYDIAVMTLSPREVANAEGCVEFVYPGDVAGFVGIDRPEVGDSRLNGARITGYPSDKPDGEMWTSGKCEQDWDTAGDYFGYHYCDTYGGNSGSSALTTGNIALGVHGYGFSNYNGACLMHGSHYDAVYEWSDQDKILPRKCGGTPPGPGTSLDDECICMTSLSFWVFQFICILIFSDVCVVQEDP
jgi:glutamyl endopeptidase